MFDLKIDQILETVQGSMSITHTHKCTRGRALGAHMSMRFSQLENLHSYICKSTWSICSCLLMLFAGIFPVRALKQLVDQTSIYQLSLYGNTIVGIQLAGGRIRGQQLTPNPLICGKTEMLLSADILPRLHFQHVPLTHN